MAHRNGRIQQFDEELPLFDAQSAGVAPTLDLGFEVRASHNAQMPMLATVYHL